MMAWTIAALLASMLGACAATQKSEPTDGNEWIRLADSRTELDGDLDAAEQRWRRLIADDRWADEALMTDDPPRKPDNYGAVALDGNSGENAAPEESKTTWETVGRATFAVFSVLLTLGMAVAPYLLA
jgi:hypothetical protein